MPWKECSVTDEGLPFVARRLAASPWPPRHVLVTGPGGQGRPL